MDNTGKSLKERQIEVAQIWANIISAIRPEYKDQKVVDVETTEHPFEVIVRFNNWRATKVVGLDAKHIIAGKIVNLAVKQENE